MDDEEVIYQGSPLACHLKECGLEFDVEEKDIKLFHNEQDSTGNRWKIINVLQGEGTTLIDDHYREKCIQMLLNSKLLVYEDSILMEEFVSDLQKNDLKTKIRETLKSGAVGVLMLVFIMLFLRLLPPLVNTALFLGLPVFLGWRWKSIITAPMQARRLKKFLEIGYKVESLTKKALLLISDYSLISRGYLMLEKANLVWRLDKADIAELSRRSQCNLPGLRTAVLEVSRRLADALSDATRELRQKRPLPHNLDHQGLYYPELDKSETGMELEKKESCPSLESLMSAANRHLLKRSEYLRRLFLDLIFTNSTALKIIMNKQLENELSQCLSIIDKALIVYKPYVSTLVKEKKVKFKKSHSRLNDLATSCHSTSIHIQEALVSSREMESIIEKSDEPESLESYNVEESFNKMNYHLKCAGLCIKRTMIVLSKNSSDSESMLVTPSESSLAESVQINATEINEMKEVIPQDEVFEIYNVGGRRFSTGNDGEESEQQLDKESKTLIMKELKNVLVVKAADWTERERLARMKQLSGDVHAHMDSEDEALDKNIGDAIGTSKNNEEKPLEEMEDAESEMPSQSIENERISDDGCSKAAVIIKPVIYQPFVGIANAMIGSMAAEAVAKARDQLSGGLLSQVESFECSDPEESQSD